MFIRIIMQFATHGSVTLVHSYIQIVKIIIFLELAILAYFCDIKNQNNDLIFFQKIDRFWL